MVADVSGFNGCTSLSNVTWDADSKMTTFVNGMFTSCTSLLYLDAPNSVTKVEGGTFTNASKLKKLTFGNNVSYFGHSENWNGYNKTIILNTSVPPTIDSYGMEAEWYVPDASLNAYNNATNWTKLVGHIHALSTYTGN